MLSIVFWIFARPVFTALPWRNLAPFASESALVSLVRSLRAYRELQYLFVAVGQLTRFKNRKGTLIWASGWDCREGGGPGKLWCWAGSSRFGGLQTCVRAQLDHEAWQAADVPEHPARGDQEATLTVAAPGGARSLCCSDRFEVPQVPVDDLVVEDEGDDAYLGATAPAQSHRRCNLAAGCCD